MHIEYHTEDDRERELQEKISKLTEDDKSEFVFVDEPLYVIGWGHAFGKGFYTDYATKCGITARQYGGRWTIGSDEYKYKDNEFVFIPPPPPRKSIDWDSFSLPTVKNIPTKTIGMDLEPVKPMNKPKK